MDLGEENWTDEFGCDSWNLAAFVGTVGISGFLSSARIWKLVKHDHLLQPDWEWLEKQRYLWSINQSFTILSLHHFSECNGFVENSCCDTTTKRCPKHARYPRWCVRITSKHLWQLGDLNTSGGRDDFNGCQHVPPVEVPTLLDDWNPVITTCDVWNSVDNLGGATQTFLYFHLKTWGRWTHFDKHIFQLGWFNHQPVIVYLPIWTG